jgi:hypothetical protein
MAREISRSVPFVTPRTFLGTLPAFGNSVNAEFDCLEGFADVNLFNNVLAYPGTNTPKLHAVGPWLDAAVFADGNTLIRVEYSVDRGCGYRPVAPDTAVAANVFGNISGLRITGRFVRVTLLNNTSPTALVNVEFGIYIRSA